MHELYTTALAKFLFFYFFAQYSSNSNFTKEFIKKQNYNFIFRMDLLLFLQLDNIRGPLGNCEHSEMKGKIDKTFENMKRSYF